MPMLNPNQAFLLVQKLKSAPRALHLGVKAELEKNLFNLPKVTNKCWTLWPCIGPNARKRIPLNLGGQFATLGAKQQAKDAQSWPQVLLALTPSVKGALNSWNCLWKWALPTPFFCFFFPGLQPLQRVSFCHLDSRSRYWNPNVRNFDLGQTTRVWSVCGSFLRSALLWFRPLFSVVVLLRHWWNLRFFLP
jgi:hypothetical protein